MLSALAVTLAACGGSGGGETGTTAAGAVEVPFRRGPTDPNKSCRSQGIDNRQVREGRCTEDDVRYVVVNRTSVLRLDTLSVATGGVSVSPIARGPNGRARARRGAYLRMSLTVLNRSKEPRRFVFGQTMLSISENTYSEALEAERVHPEALARVRGGLVSPGATLRGDVIFDVLPEAIERLPTEGRLFVANFGVRAGSRAARKQLGQFRLYATSPQPAQ